MRRLTCSLATATLLLTLGGCGSSTDDGSDPGGTQSSSVGSVDSPVTTPTPDFPATPIDVGRLTYTAANAHLGWEWHVGQPEQATSDGQIPNDIPSEAVNSCAGAGSTLGIAMSTYIPALLDVDYDGATVAQGVLNRTPVTNSSTVVAYQIDGEWTCGDQEPGILVLHPGDSRSIPALVIAQVIDNGHPTFTDDDKDSLAFGVTVEGVDLGGDSTVSVSGPGQCSSGDQATDKFLFLYRTSVGSADCSDLFQAG